MEDKIAELAWKRLQDKRNDMHDAFIMAMTAPRAKKPSFLQRTLQNWDLIAVTLIVLMLIGIGVYIVMTY